MKFIDTVFRHLKRHPKRVVFPEGADPRVLRAASRYKELGLGPAIVLGEWGAIEAAAAREGIDLGRIGVIDPARASDLDQFCRRLETLARYRNLGPGAVRDIVVKPNYFGALMIQYGQADALVGGATDYAGSLLRPLIQVVKPLPGIDTISSCVVVEMRHRQPARNRLLLFADCAVIPDPTVDQLAAIAVGAATVCRQLTGEPARVAMLSYSTRGSANQPGPRKVAAATARAKQLARDAGLEVEIDGELQVDAALDPAVAALKAPDSPVAGDANVLIFPDLDAGNIGLKLVHALSDATMHGQLLLGLSRPCGHVSRGSSVDEIVSIAAIAGLQAIEFRRLYPAADDPSRPA